MSIWEIYSNRVRLSKIFELQFVTSFFGLSSYRRNKKMRSVLLMPDITKTIIDTYINAVLYLPEFDPH